MKSKIENLIKEIHSKNEECKLKVKNGFSFDNSLPNFAACQKARYTGKIVIYTRIEKELIKILNENN